MWVPPLSPQLALALSSPRRSYLYCVQKVCLFLDFLFMSYIFVFHSVLLLSFLSGPYFSSILLEIHALVRNVFGLTIDDAVNIDITNNQITSAFKTKKKIQFVKRILISHHHTISKH